MKRLKHFYGFVRKFPQVILDAEVRGNVPNTPSVWLTIGILICVYNSILMALMRSFPYMQPVVILETVRFDNQLLPVVTETSYAPHLLDLAVVLNILNGSLLLFLLLTSRESKVDKRPLGSRIGPKRPQNSEIENLCRQIAQEMEIACMHIWP